MVESSTAFEVYVDIQVLLVLAAASAPPSLMAYRMFSGYSMLGILTVFLYYYYYPLATTSSPRPDLPTSSTLPV